MMKTKGLNLNCSVTEINDSPDPKEALIPLIGLEKSKTRMKIKEGSRVITGGQIIPGVYSTVTGTVKSIEQLQLADGDCTALRIEVSEQEELDPDIQPQPDFLEKPPAEILGKLNRANLGFCEELDNIKTVIVSAVDTDPLAAVSQQIIRENKDAVIEGLKLIKYLTSAEKVIFAVPENLSDTGLDIAKGIADVHKVKMVYPNGLPEILLRDISKSFDPGKCAFIKVEKLAASVIFLKEGKPFVHKVISVAAKNGVKNYKVRIGAPIKELLQDANLKDNDKVIIGGPFRGYACYNTEVPITGDADLLYVQSSEEVFWNENNHCMNCGRCVKECPVNLDVNLICRYAEFSIFEKCEELGVLNCIECGLCAYYCPSSRSLVQLIRLAKNEIENIREKEEQ